MTIPNQAETRFAYIAEGTPGTTPTSPAFQIARPRAGSRLKINRPRMESSELRPDRRLGSTFGGIGGASGRLATLLFHEDFQHDWLEAALGGTWATDVLLDGNTEHYKTVERKFVAGASGIYDRATGALVDTMTMTVVPNQEVTVDYDFLAFGGSTGSAILSGATYVDAEVGEAADYADISSISLFGLSSFSLARLQITVNNNLRGQPKLGTRDLKSVGQGKFRVMGSADIYLEDAAYYAAALANTVGEVSFIIGPSGGSSGARYTFTLPNCEIGDHGADDASGDGILSISWTTEFDSGIGAAMKVERNT